MKASIKFRDNDQTPLLRAKIPLKILNFPFQSGVSAGEPKDLSLNLTTFFDSGPSLKFAYRPNDSQNPFSFVFKTGIGHFGSPVKSPLTMAAEFNLVNGQNPSFFIHFKPRFGDFSLKKSHSSTLVNNDNKSNGVVSGDEGFVAIHFDEKKNSLIPVTDRALKGTEVSAVTAMPLRDFAVVNLRWGLRVPPLEKGTAAVVGKGGWRGLGGIRMPLLVMNKIGIEHVLRDKSRVEEVGAGRSDVVGACLEVKKQLEVIQAENGLLSKALSDLRSDIAAGKLDFLSERQQSKYGVGEQRGGNEKKYSGGGGDKKSSEVAQVGGEGKGGLKVAA